MTEPGRVRVFQALRSRDFRLLFAGQTVSLLGDAAFVVALGWKAFALHGTGSLGVVLMLESIGLLATVLLGGALADRYQRRRLMIASDLWRCAVVAALATADATGRLSFPLMGGCALAVGLGSGFFQPAFGGIVPLVVERGDALASANALIGLARHGSLMVGPGLAGLIYGPAGSATVFALDAATFLFSAGLLALANPRPHEPEPMGGTFGEIAAGFRYVAGVRWLWVTILLFSLFLMLALAPFQVLMPKLIEQHFHRGVGAYGLISTCMGLGMAVGTLVFGQVNPRRRRGVVSYAIWTVNAGIVVAIALSPWYALAAALTALRGAGVGFGISIWDTMLMERVPGHMLARVVSLDWFGSLGLMPLGFLLAAGVSSLASPGTILATGAAASGALFLVLLPSRWLREVD